MAHGRGRRGVGRRGGIEWPTLTLALVIYGGWGTLTWYSAVAKRELGKPKWLLVTHMFNHQTHHHGQVHCMVTQAGGTVTVRSEYGGVATFRCQEGKVPRGMIFVPYGPPTCRLMGSETDGTGMPTSKNWEVEVEPAPPGAAP